LVCYLTQIPTLQAYLMIKIWSVHFYFSLPVCMFAREGFNGGSQFLSFVPILSQLSCIRALSFYQVYWY
jgi:hypothetical protein